MRAWVFALLFLAAATAEAQTFYKWVDAEGKTRYGDQPPKGFAGKVEKIEVDLQAAPVISVPAAPPKAVAPAEARKPGTVIDIASKRRATREKLQADVDGAQLRVDQARAALEGSRETRDDERQTIRQRGDMAGTLPAAGRSNCRMMAGPDGKQAMMCPAVIPNETYYDRIREMEAAIQQAEADLDRAKEAYRRGTD